MTFFTIILTLFIYIDICVRHYADFSELVFYHECKYLSFKWRNFYNNMNTDNGEGENEFLLFRRYDFHKLNICSFSNGNLFTWISTTFNTSFCIKRMRWGAFQISLLTSVIQFKVWRQFPLFVIIIHNQS